MKEIDFSKFKKTDQDKHSATLLHPDGHEIRVAMSGLSPILRKKLLALPLHAKKGADVQIPDEEVEDDLDKIAAAEMADKKIESSPVKEIEKELETHEKPDVAAEQPSGIAPKPVAPAIPTPAPAPAQPAPQAPVAAQAPVAPQQTIPNEEENQSKIQIPQSAAGPVVMTPGKEAPEPVPVVLTPEQEAQKKTAHVYDFYTDLNSGKITPKTYSDLFESKSTLGKIGTIFGLLISGAGAGLTRQPNALLEMMNKELERDLEAQKATQANKQNWYKMSLEHERMQPENALRSAEAALVGGKAAMQKYENTQAGITDIQAYNDALNMSSAAAVHSMQETINKMPPGPQRDAMQQQQDNVVVPFFMNKVQERNKAAAEKKSAMNAVAPMHQAKANPPPKGDADPGKKYDAINQNKFAAAIQKGKFAPNAPDAIPQSLLPVVNEEKIHLEQNRDNKADTVAAFAALNALKNAGQSPGAANASTIASTVATAAGGWFGGPLGAGIAGTAGKLATAIPGETLRQYFERNRDIQINALAERLGVNKSDEAKMRQIAGLLPSWADTDESRKEVWKVMNKHFDNNLEEKAPNLRRLGLVHEPPKYKYPEPPKQPPAPKIKSTGAIGTSEKAQKNEDAGWNPFRGLFK